MGLWTYIREDLQGRAIAQSFHNQDLQEIYQMKRY